MGTIPESLEFVSFDVRDLRSVAGLFPADRGVRGIYVLHFVDGRAYVGQTVNIWNRFAGHCRTYPDIESLSFARVPETRSLDELEIAEIRVRAASQELRNITHYLRPSATRPSKLDPIVPLDHQLAFRDRGTAADIDGRVVTDEQREKGSPAFARLRANRHADLAQRLAARYVMWTIPCPRATERRFWALSAAPSTNAGNRLFCFSINKPETFVLFDLGDDVHAFMNVSRTALVEAYGSLDSFCTRHGDRIYVEEDAGYESCGGDAVRLRLDGAADLHWLFLESETDDILHAARVLNLALMRKGPTFQAKGHNVPLADVILEELLVDDVPSTAGSADADVVAGPGGRPGETM